MTDRDSTAADRDPRLDPAAMRKQYRVEGLDGTNLAPGPMEQFGRWFEEAVVQELVYEPNAMVVSTADADGRPREIVPRLLLVDVEERLEAPHGREHGQRGLHVDPDVPGVHRDRERLGGRQPGVEGAVDEQPPDVAERDVTDQILDVDAPVPQGAALLVRFGDLRLERDDSFETRYKAGVEVGHQAAPHAVAPRSRGTRGPKVETSAP